MTLKENKCPRHIQDLVTALSVFGRIDGMFEEQMPQYNLSITHPRNFNVSEAYQEITSSGYSILNSRIAQN